MTNPYEFGAENEVIQHFAQVLPAWQLDAVIHGPALSPVVTRHQDANDRSFFTLALALHNAGDEKATDARVRVRFPMKYIRHVFIPNEKKRNSHLEIELSRQWFAEQNLFDELYPQETTRVLQEIHYFVDPSEVPPMTDVIEIEVRSGNASPFKGRIAIAGLQSVTANLPHFVLPETGGYSLLSAFSPVPRS